MPHQVEAIGRIGREGAAQVGLAAGATKDLLVGGEHIHATTGVDGALHTRRAELLATLQPGLHQGALLGEQLAPLARGHRQGVQCLANALAPFAAAQFVQLEGFQLKRRIALAAEPLVQFHHAAPQAGMGFP